MSDTSNRQDKSGTPDHGPTEAPPNLPRGWIAQWDAKAGKYYFVQLSTSHAQWELPTEPAPGVDTPSSTPMSGGNSQFSRPIGSPDQSKGSLENTRGVGPDEGAESERGYGSMAVNLLAGKSSHGGHQSGLTGLAQSFLGSQSTHSGSHHSSSGGAGAIAASLLSSALGSSAKLNSKPPSGNQPSSSFNGPNASHSTEQSGAGNLLSGLFGGHTSHNQYQQFGYSSETVPASGYSGTAPPTQYKPSAHNQQTYGSSNDPYNPSGYHNQGDHQTAQSQPGGQYSGSQPANYYGVQRPDDPSKPFYVGGTPFDHHDHGYGAPQQSQAASGGYAQGLQGAYQQNQYGDAPQAYGVSSYGGYNSHPPPHRTSQYGQSGAYGAHNQQYQPPQPPPPPGGYGGSSHGGGYDANPSY